MLFSTERLSRRDALSILNLPTSGLPALLAQSYALRKKYKGDTVKIQLLTNAKSGDCSQNCAYCAQSGKARADIEKYRLVPYEKLLADSRAVSAGKLSRHCIGLSGIRFSDAEIEEFAGFVSKIKKENRTHICCSIGFLTPRQAKMLKEAGVDRINHNLNSSRRFYPHICTTHTYDERIANIAMLKELGFEICCGGIVGLGEESEDVADMLLEIQAIDPRSVPINFLIPIAGTPLGGADTSRLTPEYCLKVLCLARLLLPTCDIRCAGGREVYLKGWEKELFSVADSVFASGYLTAGGESIAETVRAIEDAGFACQIESA
ncbi:MAG: biotin synthase BioB [Acidaminococcales bacterium]|jgi:biotin synthase|nr:biotin synthase BioB [Acidaminococcales bacterium]